MFTKIYIRIFPSSIIHKSERNTLWYIYTIYKHSEIKDEWTTVYAKICKNIKHSVKQKKPEPKEHILCDPFMWNLKTSKTYPLWQKSDK